MNLREKRTSASAGDAASAGRVAATAATFFLTPADQRTIVSRDTVQRRRIAMLMPASSSERIVHSTASDPSYDAVTSSLR